MSGSERCFHVCQPVTSNVTPVVSGTVCVQQLQLRADQYDINVDTGAGSKPSALTLQTAFLERL